MSARSYGVGPNYAVQASQPDDARPRLIEAVEAELDSPGVIADDLVDALLPLVEAIAALRASEELRYAARMVHPSKEQEGYRWMVARADALLQWARR